MNQKVIPVFFAIDNKYAKYVSVAIASLIENANPNNEYIIHVVYETIDEENRKKLKSLERPYAKIEFNEMIDKLSCITDKLGNRLREELFTLTIFFRLFLPEMFPQYDKAIYLDSDTVIPGDISEFFNYDIKDYYFGGIQDISTIYNKPLANYFEKYVGIKPERYINSGVLLLNMKKFREAGLGEKFMYLYNKYGLDTIAPDQDYLNALCKDKIKYLPTCWDAMPVDALEKMKEPKIVHYNLFTKPWRYDGVDYEEYFWKYAKKTAYYDELKKEKDSYTKEQIQKDTETLNYMIQRGIELSQKSDSFKNLFESGKEERL